MTGNPLDTAGSALGTAELVSGCFELRFVRDLDHAATEVWSVLTAPDRQAEWGAGEQLTAEPQALLEAAGQHGTLRWELHPTPGGTRLTFVDRRDSGEADGIDAALADGHLHLDHLAALLAGESGDWAIWSAARASQRDELRASYSELASRS